ncbi:MAG TPA: DNA starvation/stationary phase protection protein [Holophagaceae bacterium]|nr:DNA starvation/stationary phase protection protein [Holophagaceae bacterium]
MSKAVIEHLNLELATAFVQSFNARRYHWMVSGPHFRDYHLRFSDLYEAVDATIDELAERVRMLDGVPITTPSQMESLSVVKPSDTKKRLDAAAMVKEALVGADKIVALMHKGIEIADQAGDPGTADLLTRFVQVHQKEAWFLREMLA